MTRPSGRDSQQARVYRAEGAWRFRLDAARLGARLATVAGSAILLPEERRFGTLASAADYLTQVLALASVTKRWGVIEAPTLRLRSGPDRAHWESPGVIAVPIPVHGEPWALRESVLLHELAHHMAHHRPPSGAVRPLGHGPGFPALLLALVAIVLGEEAALALRVAYGDERVEVGTL